MKPRAISDDVFLLGAIDWDRRLFDALIPLPDGTSYNAFLIRGSEKTALIDTVDPSLEKTLEEQLQEVPQLDYLVIQHLEQDHSGSLPLVLRRYPQVMIVTNPRCKGMLIDHLYLDKAQFLTVEDGYCLSLGNKTLQFIYTPWVHFPETMCTWLVEEKTLFTCDFFGSHLATTDLWANEKTVYAPAKRYYAEIMMPFANHIQKHLVKLKNYDIQKICPSHGPLHKQPSFIMTAYDEWSGYPPKNLVCLAYVSMHGSTLLMVDYLTGALAERGVKVDRFDLAQTDLGKLAMTMVDAATIVLASPTVLTGPHPQVVGAAYLVNALGPKVRQAAIIGSYGWGGKMVEKLAAMLAGLKLDLLEPVLCKGMPRAIDYEALDKLASTIANKHEGLGHL